MRSKTHKWNVGSQFEHDLIKEDGGSIEVSCAGGLTTGYGRDKDYHYLWSADKVEVGTVEFFDRWANSRDFVLHRDLDSVDLKTLKTACKIAREAGHFDDGWANEYDIAAEYRKAKRKKR